MPTTKPERGWYSDPSDPNRHRFWDGQAWTEQVRQANDTIRIDDSPGSGRPKPWLWVGLAVLILAGIGGAIALVGGDSDPDPTPGANQAGGDPTPTPTTDPSDVVVPEGWVLYSSEKGVMSYAIDPTWDNLLGPGDQAFLEDWYSDYPDTRTEYSGAWLLSPSTTEGEGVLLYVTTLSDGKDPGLIRVLARGYVDSSLFEEFEVSVDEEYINDRGYSGWRFDYSGYYEGVLYHESVIALEAGLTLVYVYGSSDEGFESITEAMLTLADSIVVHHPPA